MFLVVLIYLPFEGLLGMKFASTSVIEAHHSFATKLKEGKFEKPDRSISRLSSRVLRGAERNSVAEIDSTSEPQNASSNSNEQNSLDPVSFRKQYRDLGSKLRAKKRQTVIDNAHKSMSRHAVPSARKSYNADLFQDRLVLDHATGKCDVVNWADPRLPIADVGITLERVLIPSLLLPQSVIHEMRVIYVDPMGAAALSNRINVGDILLKARKTVNVLALHF